MVIWVNDDKEILPGEMKTFDSTTLRSIYKSDFDYETGRPKQNHTPYDAFYVGYGGGAVNRTARAVDDYVYSWTKALRGWETAWGQKQVAVGKMINSEGLIKSGQLRQLASARKLEMQQKEYEENKTYLPRNIEEDMTQGVINAGVQYLPQLAIGMATKSATVPLVMVGIQSFGGATAEGILKATERGELQEFIDNPENELVANTFRAGVNVALERVGGIPEQIKFLKNVKHLKNPTVLNKALTNVQKGAISGLSETATEYVQGLNDIYFDKLLERFDSDEELAEAYNQNRKNALYTWLVAAPAGTAAHTFYRKKAEKVIVEGLSDTDMTTREKQRFAEAVVQEQMVADTVAMTKAMDYSEQLQNKHGEVYNAIYRATFKAIQDSGGFTDWDESSKAQYASETAGQFADQAVAEAVKRNTSVENVIKAKGIKYLGNGRFQLEDMKKAAPQTSETPATTPTTEAPTTKPTTTKPATKPATTKPASLLTYIIRNGGVKDEHGELKALDAIKGRPGLVNNKTGLTLDNMRAMVAEAGYFGGNQQDAIANTTTADLIDLIDTELRGKKVYGYDGQGNQELTRQELSQQTEEAIYRAETILDQNGIDHQTLTDEEKLSTAGQLEQTASTETRDLTPLFDEFADDDALLSGFIDTKTLNQQTQEETEQSTIDYNETGVDGAKPVEVYEDGTYYGEDGHIHAKDGGVLFQEDVIPGVVDLTDAFKDIQGMTPEQTAQRVEAHLNDLIGKAIDTATAPLQVQVTKGNKAHVVHSNVLRRPNQELRHNTALLTLEKVINNAVKTDRDGTVDLTHNTSKRTLEHKSKVKQYVYFDSPIRINNQDYIVSLATEQVKGQDPNLLDLYNVHVKKGMLHAPNRTSAAHPSLNTNIPQSGTEVKPQSAKKLYQESVGINLNTEKRAAEIANLQKIQEESRVGDNLEELTEDGNFDLWVEQQVRADEEKAIEKMRMDEALYERGEDFDEVNESITDDPDYNSYNRSTPFTEEEFYAYIQQKLRDDINEIVSERINNLDSYAWDNYKKQYIEETTGGYNNRQKFFDAYQKLVSDIMEDNGYYVLQADSRVSDSRYVEVYESAEAYKNDADPISKIRISDHYTHKFYGNHINLNTTKPITSEIAKLKDSFAKGEFGIENTVYQKSATSVKRASYDPDSKVIKLLKDANAASLPHEFAHYWLDNITAYVNSGQASETYLQNFYKPITDWLGAPKWTNGFSKRQHEQFAAGYEKYLREGNLPIPILGGVFNDYDKWLKEVYKSAEDITISGTTKKPVLTPEIINFFRSMTTGGLETAAATAALVKEADYERIAQEEKEAEEAARAGVKAETEALTTLVPQKTDAEKAMTAIQTINAQPTAEKQTIAPVKGTGERVESRYYERVKEQLGIVEKTPEMERNRVVIAEERAKAAQMWKNDPGKAQRILDSGDMSNEVLRNALYTEYQRIMLESGNIDAWHDSVKQQSWEATRAGQEISALRGVVNDLTDPAYWVRNVEGELTQSLARKMAKVLKQTADISLMQQLTRELDQDVKTLVEKLMKTPVPERNKLFQEEITALQKKYTGNEQKKKRKIYQIDFTAKNQAEKYVESQVQEAIGIKLTDEQTAVIVQKAQNIDKLYSNRDELGLPDIEFFKAVKDLENYTNGLHPSSKLKVFAGTILRGSMLTSASTYVMNAASNAISYVDTSMTRRLKNLLTGQTNDTIVDQELIDAYRNKIKEVFWTTGKDITIMDSLTDAPFYRGERLRTHSEGEGLVRLLGRGVEEVVFKHWLSHPDMLVRARLYFTQVLNNEVTQQAYAEGLKGDAAIQRANELFKQAIQIQPQEDLAWAIRQRAKAESLYVTFQQDSRLADALLGIRSKIDKAFGNIGVAEVFAPFVKTPANVINTGFDIALGPLNILKNAVGAIQDKRAGLTAAKSERIDKVARSTAHTVVGGAMTGLIMLVLSALNDDDDDGYVPDYAQVPLRAKNIVAAKAGSYGAVKLGDYWVNTDYLGGLEIPLVVAMEMKQSGTIWNRIRRGISSAVTKSLDAPVVREASDMLERMKQGSYDMSKVDDILTNSLENIATSIIPNILAQVAKMTDDYERDTEKTFWKKVGSKIPGVRNKYLKPKVSPITGKAIETQDPLITFLFGSRVHADSKDPTVNMYYDLYKQGEVPTVGDITKRGNLSLLGEADKSKIRRRFNKEMAKEQRRIAKERMSPEDKKDALTKARQKIADTIKKEYKSKIDKAKRGR